VIGRQPIEASPRRLVAGFPTHIRQKNQPENWARTRSEDGDAGSWKFLKYARTLFERGIKIFWSGDE